MRKACISVEVTADTLFEAVAQAVIEFREDKTVSKPPDLKPTSPYLSLRNQPSISLGSRKLRSGRNPLASAVPLNCCAGNVLGRYSPGSRCNSAKLAQLSFR